MFIIPIIITCLVSAAIAAVGAWGYGWLAGWREAHTALTEITHHKLNDILMNQAELAAALTLANQQITKIRSEQEENSAAQRAAIVTLTAKVDELTTLLAAGTVTEDVANALASVKTSLQAFDDTIPDAPVA